jgi:hypothetical protein
MGCKIFKTMNHITDLSDSQSNPPYKKQKFAKGE